MAEEKAISNTTKHKFKQPEQVEVALSGVVDALVHHGSCQGVSILVFVVVQREEPEGNSMVSSKLYIVLDLTLCGGVSEQ